MARQWEVAAVGREVSVYLCLTAVCVGWGTVEGELSKGRTKQNRGVDWGRHIENKGFQISNEECSGVLIYFLQKSIDP